MKSLEDTSLNLVWRVRMSVFALFLCFVVIGLRLWYLQILHGREFQYLSENNRLREIYINPPRGGIYDRHGDILVENRPSFNVELVKEDCGSECDESLKNLAEILNLKVLDLKKSINKDQVKRRRFEPHVILRDISRDDVARLAARKFDLKGVVISDEPVRNYLYQAWAAHVLGYIGEISSSQLENPNYSGYRSGDIVGKSGIEAVAERLLQGQRGTRGIIVNAAGTRLKDAYYEGEKTGHNVVLTLDYRTQQAMEEAMTGFKGAAVALDPNTGEILAMVSNPSFDPNIFVSGLSSENWSALNGPDRALNNRVVQGTYPLGSVFKTIMAMAGLAEGVIHPSDVVNCTGSFRIGHSRAFSCHGHHGAVDLKLALKKSCNIYFYTVGQRLGVDRIHDYATRFGFGEKTGLELVDEKAGLVPSTVWKKKTYKAPNNKWYPGETPSVSIGQGALTVTPLQVARAMAVIANGGHVYKPYLIKNVISQDGTVVFEGQATEVRNVDIEPWVFDTVREAMVGVVDEQGGTGSRSSLKEFGITVAGKTGTAQIKRMIGTKTLNEKDSLAWFGGFAPADNPQIAVAVVVEAGGHGGIAAAPVAKKVLQAFLVPELPDFSK